jgi:hypothetical protein
MDAEAHWQTIEKSLTDRSDGFIQREESNGSL